MTKKLTFVFAIALCIAARGFAQEKDGDKHAAPDMKREKAEATWPEGKITIEYGAPAWKDSFKEEMKKIKDAWRLGNNLPTTATITCGLVTEQGNLPPGTYTLALKPAGDTWGLLFYEAKTFYDPSFKGWWVKADAPVSESKMKVDKLQIAVNDNKTLSVRFGSMVSDWTLKPIKVNKAFETTFRDVATTWEILALPLAGTTFKDTTIGVCSAAMGDTTARYFIHLTADGDKATLNFVNERAAGIAKEKAIIDDIVKRIGEMVAKEPNPEMEARLTGIKSWGEQIETTAKKFEKIKAMNSVEGTMAKRDTPATELGASFDRPSGSIVIKLALANSDASFDVKPREQFLKPREKKAE